MKKIIIPTIISSLIILIGTLITLFGTFQIQNYSTNNKKTFSPISTPISISPKNSLGTSKELFDNFDKPLSANWEFQYIFGEFISGNWSIDKNELYSKSQNQVIFLNSSFNTSKNYTIEYDVKFQQTDSSSINVGIGFNAIPDSSNGDFITIYKNGNIYFTKPIKYSMAAKDISLNTKLTSIHNIKIQVKDVEYILFIDDKLISTKTCKGKGSRVLIYNGSGENKFRKFKFTSQN